VDEDSPPHKTCKRSRGGRAWIAAGVGVPCVCARAYARGVRRGGPRESSTTAHGRRDQRPTWRPQSWRPPDSSPWRCFPRKHDIDARNQLRPPIFLKTTVYGHFREERARRSLVDKAECWRAC